MSRVTCLLPLVILRWDSLLWYCISHETVLCDCFGQLRLSLEILYLTRDCHTWQTHITVIHDSHTKQSHTQDRHTKQSRMTDTHQSLWQTTVLSSPRRQCVCRHTRQSHTTGRHTRQTHKTHKIVTHDRLSHCTVRQDSVWDCLVWLSHKIVTHDSLTHCPADTQDSLTHCPHTTGRHTRQTHKTHKIVTHDRLWHKTVCRQCVGGVRVSPDCLLCVCSVWDWHTVSRTEDSLQTVCVGGVRVSSECLLCGTSVWDCLLKTVWLARLSAESVCGGVRVSLDCLLCVSSVWDCVTHKTVGLKTVCRQLSVCVGSPPLLYLRCETVFWRHRRLGLPTHTAWHRRRIDTLLCLRCETVFWRLFCVRLCDTQDSLWQKTVCRQCVWGVWECLNLQTVFYVCPQCETAWHTRQSDRRQSSDSQCEGYQRVFRLQQTVWGQFVRGVFRLQQTVWGQFVSGVSVWGGCD